MNKSCANAIKPGGMCTWNWPLIKPGSDCLDRIGSDSGSDRIGLRIGLVSSLLVQKNYFDKSCFNNNTGGSEYESRVLTR